MAHFYQAAAPLVDGRCCPVVQFDADADAYPAIVYYGLTPETVTTLAGPFETARALRYECRSQDYDEAVDLSGDVLAQLRAGGRLIRIGRASTIMTKT